MNVWAATACVVLPVWHFGVDVLCIVSSCVNLNTVKSLECGAGYCLLRAWQLVCPH